MRNVRVSRKAGMVTMPDNSAGQGYIALTNILCNGCDSLIRQGDLFTRAHMIGGGAALFAMCRECRPFKAK